MGNPVRTVFLGVDGKPEHITHSVAGNVIWEGTESEETALRLRSGGGLTVTGPTATGPTVTVSTVAGTTLL